LLHSLPVTLTISAAFFSYLWKTLPKTTAFAVFFAQKYGYFKQLRGVKLHFAGEKLHF
jgi:hypothetical protein